MSYAGLSCRGSRWLCALLIALVYALRVAGAALGDESPGEVAPFGYRRVMVRPEQIPELARGHLPVSRVEFEQLLQAVQSRLPTAAPVTRITSAEYVARWDASQSWTGRALLTVQHLSDQAGALTLDPSTLPIQDARWRAPEGGRPGTSPAARRDPVRLGVNPRGQVTLLVDQAGVLEHGWSLAGQADSSGQTQFSARLPRAAVARLWVELPADRVLRVDGVAVVSGPAVDLAELQAAKGVVELARAVTMPNESRGGFDRDPMRDGPDLERRVPAPNGAESTDRRWWRVDFGGQNEWTAQVAPAQVAVARTPTVVWKQDVAYDVTVSGLELRSALRFDVPAAPLRQLTLSMPAALQIGSIRWGDTSLRWTAQPAGDEGGREVVVELPDLTGNDRVLHVTAMAATVLGQPWTLPVLQCRGQAWQESRATVTVSEPLILQAVDAIDGRQTQSTTVATPAPAASCQFQFHAPSGAPRVQVALPPAQVDAIVGVNFDLDATSASVRCTAALDVLRGQLFRINAQLPSAWLVDGVEMVPESLLEDFELTPTEDPLRQRLSIRLRTPLGRDDTARLIVRAHRPRTTADEPLDVADFQLLSLTSGNTTEYRLRRVIGVHAEAANRFRIRGDAEVAWTARETLTAVESELLDAESTLVFADSPASADLKVAPENITTSFSAQIQIGARVATGQIHEDYAVRCDPRGTPLGRLLILFSHARPAPLGWSIEGEPDAILSARRLPDAERGTLTRAAGEAWELLFRQTRSGPFVVSAERDGPWTEELPISLISLPDADFQDGTIRIEGVDVRPQVAHEEVETLPIAESALRGSGQIIAAFRYDPANARPIKVIPPSPDSRDTAAWAWTSRLETYCRESGERRHDIVWRIENRAATKVEVTLPEQAVAMGLFVDDSPWQGAAASRPSSNRWIVPLDSGRRFTTIRAAYVTRGARLADQSHLRPEFATLNIPVFLRTWRVLVPPTVHLHAPEQSTEAWTASDDNAWTTDVVKRLCRLLMNNGNAGERRREWDERKPDGAGHGSPWSTRAEAVTGVPERTWRTYEFVAPDNAQWQVSVEDRLRGEAWGWALLAFTAGTLATIGRRDRALLAAAIPLSAVAALLVPAPWTVHASGVFLGALLAVGLHWASRPRRVATRSRSLDGSTTASLTAAAGSLVCAVLGWMSAAHGQDDEAPVLPRVLIATDEEGRPADEYVHLPRDFYHDLRQRARGLTRPLPEWLLTAAQYRVSVREEAGAPGWYVPAVEATIEVEVLRADQRVLLPVGHAQGTLLSHQVSRHGETVDASIEASPDGWIIPLREPGSYSVTLAVRPRIGLVDARSLQRNAVTSSAGGAASGQATGGVNGASGGTAIAGGTAVGSAGVGSAGVGSGGVGSGGVGSGGAARGERMAESAATGFVLESPRIPHSQLVVEAPGADWGVLIPVGFGRLTRENAGREYRRELGPVSQLAVGVRLPEGTATSSPLVEVDELSWLRVRPGAVTYEVQWTFQTPTSRLPRVVRFAIDPRLRLVSTTAGAPLKRSFAPTQDGAWWEWEWDDTVETRQTLRATFALSGVSGIGRLRLPRLQTLDATAMRRWTAISVAPQLELSRIDAPTLAPPTWDEFQKDWGPDEAPPQIILRSGPSESESGVSVSYREPLMTANTSLDLSVGVRDARLRFDADLQTSVAPLFQLQLLVPAAVSVRDVAIMLRDDESPRATRWSRTADGVVSVLFASPMAGPARLTLEGDFPIDSATPQIPVPAITLLSAQVGASHVRIYQRPEARVELLRGDGQAVLETSAEYRVGWGRLAGQVTTEATDADASVGPLQMSVAANDARAAGTLVTTVLRTADGYAAGVAGRVTLRGGRLDRLRLEIPANWSDEISVTPAIPFERVRSAEQSRQFLVLRPVRPWTASFDFQLIGPSIGGRDERLSVPDLRFPDLDEVERYLWLPLRDRQRRIVWELSGLQATQLPTDLPVRSWPGLDARSRVPTQEASHESTHDANHEASREGPDQLSSSEGRSDEPIQVAYRVVGTRFRAAVREVEGDVGLSRVLLADHFLTLGPSGECLGASHFDVAAGSLESCEFSLPAGLELMDVRRDQLPASLEPSADGRWRLELASSAWPQRISLVYRGRLNLVEHAKSPLPTPEIQTLPTLQRLWTVATLPDGQAIWSVPQAARISLTEQNVLRLRTINEIVDYGSDALFHAGPNELRDWFEPWSRRRATLAAQTRTFGALGDAADQAWKTQLDELDDEYSQVRQSFENLLGGSPAIDAEAARQTRDAADVWRAVENWPLDWSVVTLRGDAGETFITPVRRVTTPAAPRWTLALGLFFVAPLAWYAARRGAIGEWWARWAQVILAALGLGACAAYPSWPWGLVLVVLAILAAVRSPWVIRRSPATRRER